MKNLCILLIVLVIALVISLKFVVTLINFKTIELAIFKYEIKLVISGKYDPNDTLYEYMTSPIKVFANPFDWGFKHILPPYKYELVKSYVENSDGKDDGKNA